MEKKDKSMLTVGQTTLYFDENIIAVERDTTDCPLATYKSPKAEDTFEGLKKVSVVIIKIPRNRKPKW